MNQRRLAEAAGEKSSSSALQALASGDHASAPRAEERPAAEQRPFQARPPSSPANELPPPPTPFGSRPPSPTPAAGVPQRVPSGGERPVVGEALQALREQTRWALGAPSASIDAPPKPTPAAAPDKKRDPWEAARARQRARRAAARAERSGGGARVHPGYILLLAGAIIGAGFLVNRDFGEVESGASLDQIADDFVQTPAASVAAEAESIPTSPAGEQLRWVVERLNERGATLSLSEIREHVDMSAGLPVEVIDREMQQNARSNAPYSVRAHVQEPTPLRLVMLFDTMGPHQQVITVAVSPNAPHGITELSIEDQVDVEADRQGASPP